ncbi:hypothetical protein FT663_05012 [Candidozyma haemuli var. vulneris]|uniref:Myb-like DNA-binding protein BAS1 n=1 Tax=Candidozyma haemuli TaxID=45357 RepID=A0A2V1AT39_9ASCO|nr:hypothetical protein CXQ85_004427 [[Candida] haemuloni]KAF3986119.1 hypothetical protein FT663_05012 [[Candida] haemuloni var. vulneris]KAF3988014.1 hypothetical protein FT662_03667 [[Candida] haemuloni var. vulneris]PVH20914.1 hypothetical protein CXQ85_004427 [[Candida] haemuloni]
MNKSMKRSHRPIDTLAITESLGLQTFRKGGRKAWTKQEDAKLIQRLHELYPKEASEKTLDSKKIEWELVAEAFSDTSRKAKDCRKRWASSLNPSLRRGKWTPEEDEQLLKSYKKHGPSWQSISAEVEGRTEHQCSKRYLEVLDPALSNRLKAWSLQEDLLLISQVKEHGTKWRTIAAAFDARPSLTCRNRWRNLLTSVARGRADKAVMDAMESVTGGDITDKFTVKKEDPDNHGNAGVEDGEIVSSSNIKPEGASTSPNSSRSPGPEIQLQPSEKEIEWRYAIVSRDETNDTAGPFDEILKNGGQIKSKELAQYLIQYASVYNMKVTVHQHIHHHYGSQENSSTIDGRLAKEDSPAFAVSPAVSDHSKNSRSMDSPKFYNLEPEAQLNRVQHFNYLPPLTEVPKLNSSASSPASTKEGSTHHHHHHHHHHHMHESRKERNRSQSQSYRGHEFGTGVTSLPDEARSKESDLLKLLDRADNRGSTSSKSGHKPLDRREPASNEAKSNSLTPLTQAVQMVADAETDDPLIAKRPLDGFNERSKKMKLDIPEEDGDEGLDFFETMRNLSAPYQPQGHRHERRLSNPHATERRGSRSSKGSPRESQRQNQPVSQHHPLHYSQSTVAQGSDPIPVEEEDDLLDVYGLFYNSHPREPTIEPAAHSQPNTGLLELTNPFAFPFNPS